MAKIKLKLDALDCHAVLSAMDVREETVMPDGGGNRKGRLIAEICRGWLEMRSAPAQPPEIDPGVADRTHQLWEACHMLVHANRTEHMITRLNDEETEAYERIKRLVG